MMENTIGKQFMRRTKFGQLEESLQSKGVPLPQLEILLGDHTRLIDMPDGRMVGLKPLDLIDLVEKRETLRHYAETPLSLFELAFLLWGTQGIKSVTDKGLTKRTVPSAGSRHPFETYLLVNRVNELEPGLYRYLALSNQLAQLPAAEDICQQLTTACQNQQHVLNSAVTFIWVAIPVRTVWRHRQRAYRYIHLDAGHVCQNLYLLAEAIDCGVCAIAAYDDDQVNTVLGLDGEEMFAIYLASLGKR
jgi:SagB-type dehydrogenase family enzyme